MTDSAAVRLPPMALALTEIYRTQFEIGSVIMLRRFLKALPQGDGHGVLLLPGFMASDSLNRPLRQYLRDMNYRSHGWNQGRNMGPRKGVLEGVSRQICEIAEDTGGKVSLIGHSLGGVFAREVAKDIPDFVRQVVTLGSPFGQGREKGLYPKHLFSLMNPEVENTIDVSGWHEPPPVPTTAIFTKGDGMAHWRICMQAETNSQSQNIQVRGSHCGLSCNLIVWYLLADELLQPSKEWVPLTRRGLLWSSHD